MMAFHISVACFIAALLIVWAIWLWLDRDYIRRAWREYRKATQP